MGHVSQSPSSQWCLRREGALPMILGSAFSAFLGRHISASPFLSISSLALAPDPFAFPLGRLDIYIPQGNAAKSHVAL